MVVWDASVLRTSWLVTHVTSFPLCPPSNQTSLSIIPLLRYWVRVSFIPVILVFSLFNTRKPPWNNSRGFVFYVKWHHQMADCICNLFSSLKIPYTLVWCSLHYSEKAEGKNLATCDTNWHLKVTVLWNCQLGMQRLQPWTFLTTLSYWFRFDKIQSTIELDVESPLPLLYSRKRSFLCHCQNMHSASSYALSNLRFSDYWIEFCIFLWNWKSMTDTK